MYKLVLVRHGQSIWNKESKFTGWTDVELTELDMQEAKQAGQKLKEAGYTFDEVHTNLLKRAIKTAWIVMEELELMWLPTFRSWRLNERHYGALQGESKKEKAKEVGEEQVRKWRRGFDVVPPRLEDDDPRFPGNDPRYHGIEKDLLPRGESLKQTMERALPYWVDEIASEVMDNKKILIVASHNSMRAIVKHIEELSDEEIMKTTIPTGIPLVYNLDEQLNVISKEYLATDEEIEAAIGKVKSQGVIH